MSTVQPDRSPFTQLDQMSQEMRDSVIAALDGMAADPQIQRVRARALDALRPAPGQRLLDVGCGGGEVARGLAAYAAPTGHVTAVDLAEAVVEIARSRDDGSHVTYEVGDVQKLGYPDGSFDGARTERVLQHVADPDAAVAELVRVTRSGGRVCLIDTEWDSLQFDGLPLELVGAMRQTLLGGVMLHHTDMGRTLRRRLVRAGLTEVACEPVPLWWTDPAKAAVVLPMVSRHLPKKAGIIPAELQKSWFEAVDEAAGRDEFLAHLTIWVAVGVVR
ncbi:ubiquinone/menaquinone biosynthesis C-methylase UbiE [Allocatelliglobosispora scoriae]|uniref:Ubiquinone/menaquinone biosynthesis C-methylase UbiE n=1 Tax=Allocatelliglobosispora scoriae TaxID=643052 RepID=A0A841C4L2_9ACTN|nr:methyltransferase domain-containing protein [Allocatelliglobosispora scoriae]MBB5873761.1 ubiquinone/menaquinone biosynthesis C-methylase UbiE [Allocatelliglobosispora scoriae]